MLVLASSSPRRAALLREWGYSFQVIESLVSEELPSGFLPREGVKILARRKVEAGLNNWLQRFNHYPQVILGADTLVALDGEVLGKPKTDEEAFVMLRKLSGKNHQVFTGVALLGAGGKKESEAIQTNVYFRELSDGEINDYIATGEPFDKAGAYGIQGQASKFVSEVVGSLTNVIGLPMEWLEEKLASWGIEKQ